MDDRSKLPRLVSAIRSDSRIKENNDRSPLSPDNIASITEFIDVTDTVLCEINSNPDVYVFEEDLLKDMLLDSDDLLQIDSTSDNSRQNVLSYPAGALIFSNLPI